MTDPTFRLSAYEEALLSIARATVAARADTRGMTVGADAAQRLLVDCEAALSGLIALGAVPGQRRVLTPPRAQRAATYDQLGAAAALLRRQVQLDREQSAYWRDRPDDLAAVEAWLQSLTDWAGR